MFCPSTVTETLSADFADYADYAKNNEAKQEKLHVASRSFFARNLNPASCILNPEA
jgi:hypothetical protein